MSTAVASAAAPPLAPPPSEPLSPKPSYPTIAPSTHNTPAHAERSSASATPNTAANNAPVVLSEGPAQQKVTPDGKRSPNSSRHGPPKIIVKKEPPSSPEVPVTSRHRPRKLDLSSSTSQSQQATSRPSAPLTARESSGLAMHDVGIACLSPGFQTQDPTMREQLQRSISVRDQQRHIIESRLQKTAKPSDLDGARTSTEINPFGGGLKTPSTSKKRPPAGLSIVPPSHEQFANERVIQSAPLHQSFTGRHQPHPMTRHVANQPSNLSNTSHIHHVPATQTNNTLPSISDVFAGDSLGVHGREQGSGNRYYHSNSNSSHSNHRPAFPSPGLPPPSSHPPQATRTRDYRSAEEAVADMAGGREELLPKIVHYSGHQPPTPPSPVSGPGPTPNKHTAMSHQMNGDNSRSGSGRRRARVEYEQDMGSPPLGSGRGPRRGPFGEGVDSLEMQRKKKDEFLGLCARAWDLFHS